MTRQPPTTETRNRIANNSQRGRARGAACGRRHGGGRVTSLDALMILQAAAGAITL